MTMLEPMTSSAAGRSPLPLTTVRQTGAQLVVAALEAHGVDTVFGIPGVHTLAFYDALGRSSIRHVLARHEQGAGFMADGYARATGRPGVAMVITGPGVTNIATPIGQAYTDSSPVLVISSNVERAYIDGMRGSLHDLKDQLGVMAAVTSWNSRILDASRAPAAVAEAFHRMTAGRPRPVHLEFPLDVLDQEATATIDAARPIGPDIDAASLHDAADRLRGLKRVAIYCGGGAASSGASEVIVELADLLGAPVLTSVMGKGVVPEHHPRSLGSLWQPGNAVDGLLREADALIVIGAKLGAQETEEFQFPLPSTVVRIDIDPAEMTLNLRPTVSIVGDATIAVTQLLDLLATGWNSWLGWELDRIAAARDAARGTAFGFDRLPYIDALRDAIPAGGIITHDMTMMSYACWGLYPADLPRTFLFPYGYGTLGFAMPAAIGAKIGRPETPVVAVCGDGGFQFTMEELGTAVQERLSLPIVIFNDSTYSAVKDAQRRERDGRYLGVDLVNPDYVALAGAYGIPGARAETPAALESAILAALDHPSPTLIDTPIDPWV